jgi:hypothetical protein
VQSAQERPPAPSDQPTDSTAPPNGYRAPSSPLGSRQSPARGRVDGLTVVAASVSGAALVLGVVIGAIAQQDKPPGTFVTGRDGSLQDLQKRVDKAHREAIVADVAFGVALVSGLTTAYLYLGRSRTTPAPTSSLTVSAEPMSGGGTLLVKGSF